MNKYSSTTKASYRHTSHKTHRFWLLAAAIVVAVGMLFPWFISTVSSIILYPIHATSAWIKTSDGVFPIYLRSRSELIEEIELLRKELATETGTQLSVKRLLEENMQLRSLAKVAVEDERLIARVLARPDQLSYDLLQIDKGIRDGVKVGAPVFTGVDSIIGVVVHTNESYSFVDLFTSPGFELTAFIIGPNIFSTVEGMGGGVARVRLPQGVPIRKGQLVVLPSVSGGVYGEIVRVEDAPTQPEQYGYITPPLAMNNLLYVSVGLKEVSPKTEDEINAVLREELRNSFRLSTTTTYTYSPTTENLVEDDIGDATTSMGEVGPAE